MSEMRSLSESAKAWLRDKDPRTWLRSHFSTRCKSDLLLNNNSELCAGNEKYKVDCGLGNKHVVDLLNSLQHPKPGLDVMAESGNVTWKCV
ncbi:hypothetical protein Gotur_027943 [Gossypium turneri]